MRKRNIWLMLSAGALLLPTVGAAQDELSVEQRNRDRAAGAAAVATAREALPPSVSGPGGRNTPWGTQRGAKWISASHFTVPLFSGSPTLTYDSFFFFNSPGSASPLRYYAQLDAEPGALVDLVTCVYNDSSTTHDLTFNLWRYDTNISSGTTTANNLASFTTSGSAGVGFDFLQPATAETISTTDGIFALHNYYISADVASDTSIAGCWIWWRHQVAPGPATATFADVPTSSPFFKYVEALFASGVIAGCGSGNYCPNNPVTRGQLAVFLAASLGMGFPE